jgi:hypothetical protein
VEGLAQLRERAVRLSIDERAQAILLTSERLCLEDLLLARGHFPGFTAPLRQAIDPRPADPKLRRDVLRRQSRVPVLQYARPQVH